MAKILGFLIRYFSNYYTLHRSDLAARAAPLDPRLLDRMNSLHTGKTYFRIYVFLPTLNNALSEAIWVFKLRGELDLRFDPALVKLL